VGTLETQDLTENSFPKSVRGQATASDVPASEVRRVQLLASEQMKTQTRQILKVREPDCDICALAILRFLIRAGQKDCSTPRGDSAYVSGWLSALKDHPSQFRTLLAP
jgi:hypothetical protein